MSTGAIIFVTLCGIGLILCVLPVKYVFRWQRESHGAEQDISFRVRFLWGVLSLHMRTSGGESEFAYSLLCITRHIEPGVAKKRKPEKEHEKQPGKPFPGIRTLRTVYPKMRRIFKLLAFQDMRKLAGLVLHHLWSWLKPDDLRTDLMIGTGNPMYTGLIFGVLRGSSFNKKLRGSIEPNFVDAMVEGNLKVAGTARMGGGLWRGCHVLVYAFFLVISKKIDKLLA